MDKQVKYRYFAGEIEKIRRGFNNLESRACDEIILLELETGDIPLFFLDQEKDKSLILTPYVVGVYQTSELILNLSEERRNRNQIVEKMQEANNADDILTKLITRAKTGEMDGIDPNLISVIYNDKIIPLEILKLSLKDKLKRVSLIPYLNFPDFNEKCIASMEAAIDFWATEKPENKESYRKKIGEIIKKELVPYGLTRKEYLALASSEVD